MIPATVLADTWHRPDRAARDPARTETLIVDPRASRFDMRGREMEGWLRAAWATRCMEALKAALSGAVEPITEDDPGPATGGDGAPVDLAGRAPVS